MWEGLAFQAASGATKSLFGGGSGSASVAQPSNLKSEAEAAIYGSGLDASGWAVNFSGLQNAGSNADKSEASGLMAGTAAGLPGWVFIAVAAAVVWKISRSKK